ncbi:hypothetical protein IH992_02045 [Candidatus Poribacteria bacterium]|nr:hypothetical protein [Candidatus Poribacteria bacterium]
MNAITDEHRKTLQKIIIRQAFDAKCVQSLVDAVEQFLEKARAGEFKRPLKWVDEERRIPVSVNNMLTPDEYQPALGEWFDADIIPTIEAIFDASTRCSWLTMLASGNGHHYRTPWHRDYCHVDHPVEVWYLNATCCDSVHSTHLWNREIDFFKLFLAAMLVRRLRKRSPYIGTIETMTCRANLPLN